MIRGEKIMVIILIPGIIVSRRDPFGADNYLNCDFYDYCEGHDFFACIRIYRIFHLKGSSQGVLWTFGVGRSPLDLRGDFYDERMGTTTNNN